MITSSNNKYSLIVGAGQMDKDFSFNLNPIDKKLLEEDHRRHAVFRNILYFTLQKVCFGPEYVPDQNKLQSLFDNLSNKVLHSSEKELASFISEQKIEAYIEKDFKKLSAGSKYTEWGI